MEPMGTHPLNSEQRRAELAGKMQALYVLSSSSEA